MNTSRSRSPASTTAPRPACSRRPHPQRAMQQIHDREPLARFAASAEGRRNRNLPPRNTESRTECRLPAEASATAGAGTSPVGEEDDGRKAAPEARDVPPPCSCQEEVPFRQQVPRRRTAWLHRPRSHAPYPYSAADMASLSSTLNVVVALSVGQHLDRIHEGGMIRLAGLPCTLKLKRRTRVEYGSLPMTADRRNPYGLAPLAVATASRRSARLR